MNHTKTHPLFGAQSRASSPFQSLPITSHSSSQTSISKKRNVTNPHALPTSKPKDLGFQLRSSQPESFFQQHAAHQQFQANGTEIRDASLSGQLTALGSRKDLLFGRGRQRYREVGWPVLLECGNFVFNIPYVGG